MSNDVDRYKNMEGDASAVLGGAIYDTPHSSLMYFGDAEVSDATGTATGKDVMELGLLREGSSTLKRSNVKISHSALQKSKALVSDLKESLPSEHRVQRLFIAVNVLCLVLSLTALAVAGMALKNSASGDTLLSTSGSASKQGAAESSAPGKSSYKHARLELIMADRHAKLMNTSCIRMSFDLDCYFIGRA